MLMLLRESSSLLLNTLIWSAWIDASMLLLLLTGCTVLCCAGPSGLVTWQKLQPRRMMQAPPCKCKMFKAHHNIGQALSSNFHADCLKLSAAALVCNLQHNFLHLQADETRMVCQESEHVSAQIKVNRAFTVLQGTEEEENKSSPGAEEQHQQSV